VLIITGAFTIYRGSEIFDHKAMLLYLDWNVIKSLPASETFLYIGKGLEFVTGICFVLACLQDSLLYLWQLICYSFFKVEEENFGMKISTHFFLQ
jgi:hypothetical protein